MLNRKKVVRLSCFLIIFILLIILIWYLVNDNTKNTIMNNEQSYMNNVIYNVPTIQENLKNNLDFSSMSEEEIQKYEEWWIEAKNKRTCDNVTIEIKAGTLTNSSVIIIITDKNEVHYEYGDTYRIDKKEKEKWKEAKRKFSLPRVTDTISHGYGYYKVGNNGKVEIAINWEEKYGKLKKGEYRLVKFIDNKEIYTEFIIN